jgi:hypothetical protein
VTERQPARYVFTVEVEGSTAFKTTLDGFIGFGDDNLGALTEGLRVTQWLLALANNIEQAAREEFNDGATSSDLQE